VFVIGKKNVIKGTLDKRGVVVQQGGTLLTLRMVQGGTRAC
jgi:hypothetical protein